MEYLYLVNMDLKHVIAVNGDIGLNDFKHNSFVHYLLVNYCVENRENHLILTTDTFYRDIFTVVELTAYIFTDPRVNQRLKRYKLNRGGTSR